MKHTQIHKGLYSIVVWLEEAIRLTEFAVVTSLDIKEASSNVLLETVIPALHSLRVESSYKYLMVWDGVRALRNVWKSS